jgi:hypothetical protein
MISENDEYKKMINHRLEENVKSFKLLYGIKHYGNCISIMCQELDQIIRLLFLLNSSSNEKKQFINSSINNHKWYIVNSLNKKENITDKMLLKFTETLNGWDKSIYEFGFSFTSLSNNFNYGSKDPIKSMNEADRKKLSDYIIEYHIKDFPEDFSLDDLIPVLPMIIKTISSKLKSYMKKI